MKSNWSGPIYWSLLSDGEWRLYIAATEDGLCFIGSQNGSFAELEDWVESKRPKKTSSGSKGLNQPLIENGDKIRPYAEELVRYLRGELERFTIPFCYQGTPFQESVWQALCQIPYGQTKTYSDIAEYIGRPSAIRAVATAIGANPVLITVPCHRVIGKNGALSGYRGGLQMKARLLKLEQGEPRSSNSPA